MSEIDPCQRPPKRAAGAAPRGLGSRALKLSPMLFPLLLPRSPVAPFSGIPDSGRCVNGWGNGRSESVLAERLRLAGPIGAPMPSGPVIDFAYTRVDRAPLHAVQAWGASRLASVCAAGWRLDQLALTGGLPRGLYTVLVSGTIDALCTKSNFRHTFFDSLPEFRVPR